MKTILLQFPAESKGERILKTANIWQSYERKKSLVVFDSQCIIENKSSKTVPVV